MFSENLKRIRKAEKLTLEELACRINMRYGMGITKGTLSKYENGKQSPLADTVNKLATVLDVSIDELLGNGDGTDGTIKGIKIPVYGKVAAGIPIDAVEDILDYEEISPEVASDGDFFALKIKGTSMEPKISNGDVVIIRRQDDVESGQVAVVLVGGEEATVKKLIKQKNGIVLMPTNPTCSPIYFSNREIQELPVTVIGKVIELRAKF